MRSPVGTPALVTASQQEVESCVPLNPVPLETGVQESWLQEVLHACPALLPIAVIDDRPALPLVSLGREVGTASGPIDNLFISQNGQLVIVETKLWRNSEARRKVVSQILDYASQVRQWNYGRLERAWRQVNGSSGSLYEFVGPAEYDEAEWIDTVNRNLDCGRMTLVIVGDGIRSEARELAETVNRHPDYEFRLAMVELRLFQLNENQVVAIPTTLVRTQEIVRAVVRIEKPEGFDVPITVETPSPAKAERPAGTILSESAFMDELKRSSPRGERDVAAAQKLLSALLDSSLIAEWGTASLKIRTVSQTDFDRMISLLILNRGGTLTDTGALHNELPDRQGEENPVYEAYSQALKRLGAIGKQGKYETYYHLNLAALDGREAELVEALEDVVQLWHKTSG